MLRRYFIPLLIAVVPSCVVLLVMLSQRSLTAGEASDFYRRYEHNEHVSVTFLKDFPIDDTLSVDVTLLQVQDSITWANLVIELCHNGNPEDYLPGDIFFKPIPKKDSEKIPDGELKNDCIIISSSPELTIGIIHLRNLQQQKRIIDSYIHTLQTKN